QRGLGMKVFLLLNQPAGCPFGDASQRIRPRCGVRGNRARDVAHHAWRAEREGPYLAPLLPRARLEYSGGSPHPGEPAVKIILAGAGAFGANHLDAIQAIGNVEVVSLVGGNLQRTRELAKKYGIGHVTTGLSEALNRPGVEAAILATPTPLHAAQAIACLKAGKHVQVEIPLADGWSEAQAVADLQQQTG